MKFVKNLLIILFFILINYFLKNFFHISKVKLLNISVSNIQLSSTNYIKNRRILYLPSKYIFPYNTIDLNKSNEFSPYLWKIFSDRNRNITFYSPKAKNRFKTLYFMESFYVIEENDNYIHIIKDPNPNGTFLSKNAKDYGWIEKKNVLLWPKALINRTNRLRLKVLIKPNVSIRNINFSFNPFLVDDYSMVRPKVAQIYYIYKTLDVNNDGHSDYILLGLRPKIFRDDNIILGWVKKENFTILNQIIALEPNWEEEAKKERLKGLKAIVFNNPQSANDYLNHNAVLYDDIIWMESKVDNRNRGKWGRFLIIRKLNQNLYVVSTNFFIDLNSATLGVAPMFVKNQREPLFKKVILMDRLEIGRVVDILYKLSNKNTSNNIRKALYNNWINVINEEIGDLKRKNKMRLKDLDELLIGFSPLDSKIMNSELIDILNTKKITENEINLYMSELYQKGIKLKRIFNSDYYPYSFLNNEVRYFWVPTDLLP